MQFIDLQTELAELHLDTTTTWAAGGTLNKKVINKAYERLYNRYKNAERVKRAIFVQKVAVNFTNKTASLPSDFDVVDRVSYVDFATSSDFDITDALYFSYRITGEMIGARTMILEDDIDTLYISYVPKRVALSADSDVPNLPEEMHRSIVDYALVEYFRRIRDWVEVKNSDDLAKANLNEYMKAL